MNNFSALAQVKSELETELTKEREKVTELENSNKKLKEEKEELENKVAKNKKEKLLSGFESKLSKEVYNNFKEKLDEYDYSDLKVKILENSVEFLSNSSHFYQNYNSTIDQEEDFIVKDDEEDWKKEVYARQQEDK